MSTISQTSQSVSVPRTWRKWFLSSRWVRAGLVSFLILAVIFANLYRARRGVWAVLAAGGICRQLDRSSLKPMNQMDGYAPGFISFLSQWSRSEFVKSLLLSDDSVHAVNLALSRMDERSLGRLRSMTSLQRLGLRPKQISPELASIGAFTNLQHVDIFFADSNTHFENLLLLKSVNHLWIGDPRGFDASFASLGKLPSLQHLSFAVTDARSEGLPELLEQCRGWTNIQSISIRSVQLLSPGLQSLQTCDALTSLEISAPLSHDDILAIAAIARLTNLTVTAKTLTRQDYLAFARLKQLRSLKVYSMSDDLLPADEMRKLLPDCAIEILP